MTLLRRRLHDEREHPLRHRALRQLPRYLHRDHISQQQLTKFLSPY